MFIAITMNHLRVIKAWADAHQGKALLDLSSFELEIKARNRYYRLYPQFLAEIQGRMSHVTDLLPDATSFVGWRPYRPMRCSLSSDKLVFKRAMANAGLPTPQHWSGAEEATADFILKRSVGSFGYQLAGPFRQGVEPQVSKAMNDPSAQGQLFAETFVQGHNIKSWFWGGDPVHVQCQPYAWIEGDGQESVQTLIAQRLEEIGEQWSTYEERDAILSALMYQGVSLSTVLPANQKVWLDYRYGRRFSHAGTTESQDNVWPRITAELRSQITQAGQWLATALKDEIKAPMLCAMDGVLDDAGKIWWLELNSNPICPPTAYPAMLGSLFGTSSETPKNAFATVVRSARSTAQHQTVMQESS